MYGVGIRASPSRTLTLEITPSITVPTSSGTRITIRRFPFLCSWGRPGPRFFTAMLPRPGPVPRKPFVVDPGQSGRAALCIPVGVGIDEGTSMHLHVLVESAVELAGVRSVIPKRRADALR